MDTPISSHQEEFDKVYITSSEICTRLHVTRAGFTHVRAKYQLPTPIVVGRLNLFIWKRAEVEHIIEALENGR